MKIYLYIIIGFSFNSHDAMTSRNIYQNHLRAYEGVYMNINNEENLY